MIELNPLIKKLISENWSRARFLFEVFKFHMNKYPTEEDAKNRLGISKASYYRIKSQIKTEESVNAEKVNKQKAKKPLVNKPLTK